MGSLPSVVKNIVALAVSHVKTKVAEIAKTEPNGRISGVFVFGCKVNLALTGAESAYPPFFVRAVRCTTPVRARVRGGVDVGERREEKVYLCEGMGVGMGVCQKKIGRKRRDYTIQYNSK